MVTEQLDAARDVALRCFRSHSAFLFNTFVGRHSGGHRRPIREIQEKLAEDLHLLVRILVEAREKVTPAVTDAILVASGDGPPPPTESTWHELAVASILRLLVDAECQAAISRPMVGEPLPDRYPLPFDHPDDADRLRDMILRCSADGIAKLMEGYKPSRGETLGDVEAGINREWGAARKRTPPRIDQEAASEPRADAEHIVSGVLLAAAGDDAPIRAVMAIAHDKTLTAEQKMVKILLDSTNRRFEAFSSEEWGQLLGVKAQAIRKTTAWTALKDAKRTGQTFAQVWLNGG